jgi:SAM-dependent methyltransferase
MGAARVMIVDDRHFEYLKLQRGGLDAIAHDRAAWLRAYRLSLEDDLASMAPHLPERCRNVLDVGSGLGGIDVLLARKFPGLYVSLMDGVDDPPVMHFHNRTYNDMKVACDFQKKNGVEKVGYYSTPPIGSVGFDLIISIASWCFHYGPSAYLAFVRRCCHPKTVLILDVRADQPLWRLELRGAFNEVGCALAKRKFNRLVFHVR